MQTLSGHPTVLHRRLVVVLGLERQALVVPLHEVVELVRLEFPLAFAISAYDCSQCFVLFGCMLITYVSHER